MVTFGHHSRVAQQEQVLFTNISHFLFYFLLFGFVFLDFISVFYFFISHSLSHFLFSVLFISFLCLLYFALDIKGNEGAERCHGNPTASLLCFGYHSSSSRRIGLQVTSRRPLRIFTDSSESFPPDRNSPVAT